MLNDRSDIKEDRTPSSHQKIWQTMLVEIAWVHMAYSAFFNLHTFPWYSPLVTNLGGCSLYIYLQEDLHEEKHFSHLVDTKVNEDCLQTFAGRHRLWQQAQLEWRPSHTTTNNPQKLNKITEKRPPEPTPLNYPEPFSLSGYIWGPFKLHSHSLGEGNSGNGSIIQPTWLWWWRRQYLQPQGAEEQRSFKLVAE